ncbi:MAG: DNRLRE domain-containing protein, partial [Clostridia bacterium]|nr:DNRLRE domain-containing protein [Clostridia bacterium]
LQSVDGDRFETKAGPVKISVPSSLSDEDAVEYSDGEHSVMFRLDTEKAAKGTRKAKEKKNKKINELSEAIALQDMADEDFAKIYGKTKEESAYLDNIDGAIEEHNQLMMTSEKLGSQITYGSVFNDTDLRYTVTGTTLKEEIILKTSAGIQKKYEFIIGSETLTPVLMDDNSVQLCDGDGNKVFEINSPYMYDAAGEISEDIKVSLKKNSDGTYTYALKPDKKWLEDEERVYPVVIDPPVSNSSSATILDATAVFADSVGTLDDGIEYKYLKVGNRSSGEGTTPEVQAMLYSALPEVLTKGSTKIINAKLMLIGYRASFSSCPNGIQINAYKVTTDWNVPSSGVITLGEGGSSLSDNSDIIDFAIVNDTNYDNYHNQGVTWDMTEAVQDWHEGNSPNLGISLKATGLTPGVENFARFYDSTISASAGYENACPQFIYTYRDLRGVEDYWTFTSMGAGRFGTIGVNNFNGNPVITQPLVSSSGNNMPVSVSLIYSYNSQDSGKCGFGNWRTNYHMNIETCDNTFKIGETVIANYKYCFVDSDGTRHYLKEEGSEHKDEDGLGLTMTVLEGVTDHLYLLETKDKTKYKFDHYGRLVYIEDSNGNWNRICFVGADPSKQVIDYIVEGNKELTSTMQTSFEYGVWDTTIESPHGNKAIVSFTSTTKNIVFGFCYEDTHWESRTGATQIRWDGNGFPLAIYDGYGHRTYIESSEVNGVRRVTGMSYGTGNSCLVLENAEPALDMNNTLQRFTFDYNTNYTTITDIDGRAASYQFNNYGLTVGVVDHTTSWAQSYEYGVANNQNKGYENKLTLASKTIAPSENRAVYPGFDEADSINYYSVYPETAAITKTYVSDRGNTDAGVMKLERNEGDQTATFISQKVSGLEVGNYTLSMYVSKYGTTLSGEGILAQISVNNSSGYRTSSVSSAVTYTDIGKWTRIQTTIEIVAGDTSVDIGVYFPADTCGLVYVDDIQIECNRSGGSLNDSLSGAGSFNLLENTTFAPASNTVRSCWTGGAIVSYDRTSDAPTAVRRYATFNNDPAYANYAKKIQQSVYISGSGNEGDIFIAGCWAKVNSVPLDNNDNKGGAACATLLVKFYDENDLHVKTEHISCNTAIEDWQFLMMKIVAPANFAKVVYCFDYSNNEGTAMIATPFLYKETYGQS